MKPTDPQANRHHTGTYMSEEDFYNENLGKGPGDFDLFGHEDEASEPAPTPIPKKPF